jgi:hypothetical protein
MVDYWLPAEADIWVRSGDACASYRKPDGENTTVEKIKDEIAATALIALGLDN